MFSQPQIIKFYRPMVDKAWRAHCDRECITDSTEASKKDWKEAELMKCLGVTTTKRSNKGKDFDKVMAHFEELADEGIFWQMKLLQGDSVRARHNLESAIELLRLDDAYIGTIADRMGIPQARRTLTAEQAVRLRIALLYHVRRKQTRITREAPSP